MIYTWQERCAQFEDGRIVTNAMIQRMMQEEIDELRSKIDKMLDDTVSLTDNLFSERRECLKLEKELALQKLSDIGQEIENEQVGWLGYHEGHLVSFLQTQEQIESFLENTNTAGRVLPVYTHQMRELTDEQMLEVYKKVFNKQNEFKENLKRRSYFDFARAILKKASEK